MFVSLCLSLSVMALLDACKKNSYINFKRYDAFVEQYKGCDLLTYNKFIMKGYFCFHYVAVGTL